MNITVEEAVDRILNEEVVALPTETVYGLAALPSQSEKIYELKQRPKEKRFSVGISDVDQLKLFGVGWDPSFERLAAEYWPGPLTLVLPSNEGTTAFRMADQAETLAVIQKTGPIVLTSANLAGEKSSTSAKDVTDFFGKEFPVLDGGECRFSFESTIIGFDGDEWKLLREGVVKFSSLSDLF